AERPPPRPENRGKPELRDRFAHVRAQRTGSTARDRRARDGHVPDRRHPPARPTGTATHRRRHGRSARPSRTTGYHRTYTAGDAAEALQGLSPTLRLLVIDGVNGSRIVDDSYNASPESVLAALNLLRELPGRRKIGVLGDMLELGSEERPGHQRVGIRAAAVLDLLIAYGPRSKITADEARRAGLSREQVLEPR